MLHFFQIALVSDDLPASLQLYSQAFGFRNGGAQGSWGSRIQGLGPDSRHVMWWLVGEQDFFQFEIFHYSNPKTRPLRADWSPADHGWTRFGVSVPDFDDCLAVMSRHGLPPLGPVVEKDGLRRVAIRDPHVGHVIEIIEAGATGQKGPIVPYVTSSVSDLAAAQHFYCDLLGLPRRPLEDLHSAADEAMWGLAGAQRDGFLVEVSGGLLEVVSYRSPQGRAKPADWRLSDQGIQNIALGSRDREEIRVALEAVATAGHVPPYLFDNGGNICGYINDHEREIEFASVPAEMDVVYGFEPLPLDFFGRRNDRLY